MKFLPFVIAVLIGVLLLVSATLILPEITVPTSPDVQIVFLSTDREVYHSKETMVIRLSISSSANLNNLSIGVGGITDRNGQARLNQTQEISLIRGINEITFNHTLPICSRCAGLPPGNYSISVLIHKDTVTLANATHNIRLE